MRNSPIRGKIRLELEALEERALLATCTVTNLGDTGAGSELAGDLRYCTNLSNSSAAPDSRIEFEPGLSGKITLQQGHLTLLRSVVIDGPDTETITVSGGLKSGVFHVPIVVGPISVSIDDLTVTEGIGVEEKFFTRSGGGFLNGRGNVTLTRVVITGNVINNGYGGGIYNHYGTMTLNSCVVSNNSTREGYAGGIRNDQFGTMTLIDTVVSGNRADYWAGISTNGTMTILRSHIDGNITDEFGGGIDASGFVTVIDSTINGNIAPHGGAGIYNVRGVVTVRGSTIADNRGTGVHTSGWTEITDSTIARNHGAEAGGFYVYGGTLRVTNSTLSGNISNKTGGAIRIVEFVNPPDAPDVVVELTGCTITGNMAKGTGGGGGVEIIATPDGTARAVMRSCLIAGNRSPGAGDDVHGSVISIGYNFIGNGDGSSGWAPKDIVGTSPAPLDPKLGPLGDYGGKTQTHALSTGSPAIRKGDPSLKGSYDQRGTWRQPYFNPDPGAFQSSEALQFKLIVPSVVTKGQPFAVTLLALDADGNLATLGPLNVRFESSDAAANLPPDYTFTPSDFGSHDFIITLNTAGLQTLTAEDPDGFPFTTVELVVEDNGRSPALQRRPRRR